MPLLSSLYLVVASFNIAIGVAILVMNPRSGLNRAAALGAFLASWWVVCAAVASVAADANTFWWAVRLSWLPYALQPVASVTVILFLANFPWRTRWAVLAVPLVLKTFEIVATWTGTTVISGYHTGPWGNVCELSTSAWPLVSVTVSNLTHLLGLVLLFLGRRLNPTDSYRRVMVILVVGGAVSIGGATFSGNVVWLMWGYPDFSPALTAVIAVALLLVILRYDHVLGAPRVPLDQLLQAMTEPLAFVGRSGTVLDASDVLLELLSRSRDDVVGHTLAQVLVGWPQLAELQAEVMATRRAQRGLEGQLVAGKFTLALLPHTDRFGDFDGLLARLHAASPLDLACVKFGLTPREREVAEQLIAGLNTQEIAAKLYISPVTVKNHLAALFRKTGTGGRVEALAALRAPS